MRNTYFEKIYPALFWLLAIHPIIFYFIPKDPRGQQPYLYIPVALSLVLLILPSMIELPRGALRAFSPWVKLMWIGLMLMAVAITLHNFEFSTEAIRYVFGTMFGAGTWFAPLAMLAGARAAFWKRILPHFKIHTGIGLILAAIYALSLVPGYKIVAASDIVPKSIHPSYQIIDYESASSFLYAAGFLFLCLPVPSTKNRLMASGGLIFMFIYKGFLLVRRNIMFKNANYILFFFLHWLLKVKERFAFQKLLVVYAGVILLVVTSWAVLHGKLPSFLKEPNVYLQKKLMVNTRRGLFSAFIRNMERSKLDMIVGKGAWGKWGYLQKIGKGRITIENGYAYIFLKGGVLTLIPFLLLTWTAAFKGIRGRNWFIQSCGLYVLCRLLDMVPYGLPIFDGNYLIFWLCVGACLNPRLRAMNENQIDVCS